LAKGNPTRLVDEWATCMRSHGDPNQVDPTIGPPASPRPTRCARDEQTPSISKALT
jgi:hypothetical protein